jgi:hypothetical protein
MIIGEMSTMPCSSISLLMPHSLDSKSVPKIYQHSHRCPSVFNNKFCVSSYRRSLVNAIFGRSGRAEKGWQCTPPPNSGSGSVRHIQYMTWPFSLYIGHGIMISSATSYYISMLPTECVCGTANILVDRSVGNEARMLTNRDDQHQALSQAKKNQSWDITYVLIALHRAYHSFYKVYAHEMLSPERASG